MKQRPRGVSFSVGCLSSRHEVKERRNDFKNMGSTQCYLRMHNKCLCAEVSSRTAVFRWGLRCKLHSKCHGAIGKFSYIHITLINGNKNNCSATKNPGTNFYFSPKLTFKDVF